MERLDSGTDQFRQLVDRIRAEYREMPGLCLTKTQFQRLWGLDADTCQALVEALESTHFLRQTDRHEYVMAGMDR
jgi:hypothetical protein